MLRPPCTVRDGELISTLPSSHQAASPPRPSPRSPVWSLLARAAPPAAATRSHLRTHLPHPENCCMSAVTVTMRKQRFDHVFVNLMGSGGLEIAAQ